MCTNGSSAKEKQQNPHMCGLKRLNRSVVRSKYILPVLDDVLYKLSGVTMLSKLDASSGFCQIPLDENSSSLTTFITPFGRFRFRRLPFGITSAPEVFQLQMEKLLDSLPGVIIIMDDILVYGTTKEEHDGRLQTVLETIKSSGLKLNKSTCMFSQRELTFMGNIVSKDGVKPDPEKVSAICQFPAPENITGLRRVIGIANYLDRFIPDLSTLIRPMTDLLKSDVVWQWGTAQEKSFSTPERKGINHSCFSLLQP